MKIVVREHRKLFGCDAMVPILFYKNEGDVNKISDLLIEENKEKGQLQKVVKNSDCIELYFEKNLIFEIKKEN